VLSWARASSLTALLVETCEHRCQTDGLVVSLEARYNADERHKAIDMDRKVETQQDMKAITSKPAPE
jgi:hypothetical protein